MRSPKLLVAAVVVGAVIVLGLVGVFDPLFADGRLEAFLDDAGPWGRVVYVALFTLLQPVGAPGAVLIVPATFIWPGWQVFLLSWLGGVIASAVGFYLARWLGQDWVDARLPERFRRWDDRLASHGTLAVIGLRLVTGFAPPADWLLGVSSATQRQFWVGTIVGLSFSSALIGFFGDDGVRVIADFVRWVVIAAVIIAAVVGVALLRRRRNARSVE